MTDAQAVALMAATMLGVYGSTLPRQTDIETAVRLARIIMDEAKIQGAPSR